MPFRQPKKLSRWYIWVVGCCHFQQPKDFPCWWLNRVNHPKQPSHQNRSSVLLWGKHMGHAANSHWTKTFTTKNLNKLFYFEGSPPWEAIWKKAGTNYLDKRGLTCGLPQCFDACSGMTSVLTCVLPCISTLVRQSTDVFKMNCKCNCWHTIWHSIWNIYSELWQAIWHIVWHYVWQIFSRSIWHILWHSIWHAFWHSTTHMFWHSVWQISGHPILS